MARRGENIYKRKDGRWEGRVPMRNGKYKSFYAKTYREVREKMKSIGEQRTIPLTIVSSTSKQDAATLFNNWLANDLSARLKPSTYESYYRCIKKYVVPHFKKGGNEHLTELSIARFTKSMKENGHLSDAYRRKILSIFKTALRELSRENPEYASLLACVALPTVKSHPEIPVFTMREQRLIESAVQRSSDRKALGIILCFYTGIRIGELCALKWSDFDLDAGTMSVCRTVSRIQSYQPGSSKTTLQVGTPKSRSSLRKIPLPAFLMELARSYKLDTLEESFYILSGRPEPFDPRSYQRIYKKILKEAGVKNRKFHATRHSFATRALELGVDIKTLSEILGHSNVSITLNIYAHSLLEQKKIAIEKFNEMHVCHMQSFECAVTSVVMPIQKAR